MFSNVLHATSSVVIVLDAWSPITTKRGLQWNIKNSNVSADESTTLLHDSCRFPLEEVWPFTRSIVKVSLICIRPSLNCFSLLYIKWSFFKSIWRWALKVERSPLSLVIFESLDIFCDLRMSKLEVKLIRNILTRLKSYLNMYNNRTIHFDVPHLQRLSIVTSLGEPLNLCKTT